MIRVNASLPCADGVLWVLVLVWSHRRYLPPVPVQGGRCHPPAGGAGRSQGLHTSAACDSRRPRATSTAHDSRRPRARAWQGERGSWQRSNGGCSNWGGGHFTTASACGEKRGCREQHGGWEGGGYCGLNQPMLTGYTVISIVHILGILVKEFEHKNYYFLFQWNIYEKKKVQHTVQKVHITYYIRVIVVQQFTYSTAKRVALC